MNRLATVAVGINAIATVAVTTVTRQQDKVFLLTFWCVRSDAPVVAGLTAPIPCFITIHPQIYRKYVRAQDLTAHEYKNMANFGLHVVLSENIPINPCPPTYLVFDDMTITPHTCVLNCLVLLLLMCIIFWFYNNRKAQPDHERVSRLSEFLNNNRKNVDSYLPKCCTSYYLCNIYW